MSVRWPRYLPRFPAIVLIPVIAAWWFVNGFQSHLWGSLFFIWIFPLETHLTYMSRSGWYLQFKGAFVVDLATFLVVGYVAAIAADRVLFPYIRYLMSDSE